MRRLGDVSAMSFQKRPSSKYPARLLPLSCIIASVPFGGSDSSIEGPHRLRTLHSPCGSPACTARRTSFARHVWPVALGLSHRNSGYLAAHAIMQRVHSRLLVRVRWWCGRAWGWGGAWRRQSGQLISRPHGPHHLSYAARRCASQRTRAGRTPYPGPMGLLLLGALGHSRQGYLRGVGASGGGASATEEAFGAPRVGSGGFAPSATIATALAPNTCGEWGAASALAALAPPPSPRSR